MPVLPDRATPVLYDFESVSRADLPSVGGRRYWEHASTRALCCSWFDTRSGKAGTWLPGEQWPHKGRTLAAHNAKHFDRFGAAREFGHPLDCEHLIDTADCARAMGYPGSLALLGERSGFPKDTEASRFTKSLSTIRRPTKAKPNHLGLHFTAPEWACLDDDEQAELGIQTEITPDALARVVAYCEQDVEVLRGNWPVLSGFVDLEPEIERMDCAINDRGVPFDSDLARALLRCIEINTDSVVSECAKALGWSKADTIRGARSNKVFCETTGAGDMTAETVALMLAMPDPHPLAIVRQATATIAGGKLEAGLRRVCPDGRLRDSHQYLGAHTWRWSGRGMQLQNMTKPDKAFEGVSNEDLHAIACEVAAGRMHADQAMVDWLTRATIWAPDGWCLVAYDLAGIEARVNAWFAGDHAALEDFRIGRDPYKVAAASIYGVKYDDVTSGQRKVGKETVLACGYQMGPDRFEAQCLANGVDLAAIGLDASDVVETWRKDHAPIVQWWRGSERAFVAACEGHVTHYAGCEFTPSDNGRDVAIFLPSGRPIVYPEARISMTTTRSGWQKPSPSYLNTKGQRVHLYGGMIVENIVQATSRDVFAEGMLRCERAGLPIHFDVHDEAIAMVRWAERKEAGREMDRQLSTTPDWAEGLPVRVTGFVGRRYQKAA